MKFFLTLFTFLVLVSCNLANYPGLGSSPTATSAGESEREFNELMKTYKPPTEEALNDLLNENSDSTKTTVMFRNASSCNIVLTVSGNGYLEKIPIPAGKLGYAVLKKGTYSLSSLVCRSIYRGTKTFTTAVTVTLKD